MIDGSVVITPPGGPPTDYSGYLQKISVKWPATTDIPTMNVT